MAINYVEQFSTTLEQKYTQELVSTDLTNKDLTFVGANAIRIPRLSLAGYKEHNRAGGWNRQAVSNDFEIKKLEYDRNVEFYVDAMDIDETNQVLSAANITNEFVTAHAIPEADAYRFSKAYSDYTDTFSKTALTDAINEENILLMFDEMMEEMDDAGVPQDGRILYVTAAVQTMLKRAQELSRFINVGVPGGAINRAVRSLDGVTIKMVPKARFKTKYDFTDGFVPGVDAKQINLMLVHPTSVIAVNKHSAIYLWPAGTHTGGDGWLYQNRAYGDLFLVENKLDGIKMHVEA